MNAEKHPCAVCPRQVNPGLLMCLRHWRLVPPDQQRAVYATYRRMTRARGPGALDTVRAYREARDAAIRIAQADAEQPQTKGEDQ